MYWDYACVPLPKENGTFKKFLSKIKFYHLFRVLTYEVWLSSSLYLSIKGELSRRWIVKVLISVFAIKPLQDCRGFGKTKRTQIHLQTKTLNWVNQRINYFGFSLVFYFPVVSRGCGWCNHKRTSVKQWKDIEQNCAPVPSVLHSFQVLEWVKSFLCSSICDLNFSYRIFVAASTFIR